MLGWGGWDDRYRFITLCPDEELVTPPGRRRHCLVATGHRVTFTLWMPRASIEDRKESVSYREPSPISKRNYRACCLHCDLHFQESSLHRVYGSVLTIGEVGMFQYKVNSTIATPIIYLNSKIMLQNICHEKKFINKLATGWVFGVFDLISHFKVQINLCGTFTNASYIKMRESTF